MTHSIRGLVALASLTAGLFVATAMAAPSAGGDEAAIRDNWKELQVAIAKKDTGKIWSLVSSKAKAEADKVAAEAKDEHAKLDAAGKAKQAKQTGVPAATLAKMTGQDYFKSSAFMEKYVEVSDSKIDKIVVSGDKATLHYIEEDMDKRQLEYVKQDNAWKADVVVSKLR